MKGIFIALICQDVFRLTVSTVLSAKTVKAHLDIKDVVLGSTAPLMGRRKEIAKFLMHTNFLAYFRMLNTKVDILILGYFRSAGEVGIYKLARALASLIGKLSDPFFSAILPDLSRLWTSGKIAEYRQLIRKSFKSMCIIILPAAFIVMLMSELVVGWVSGETFASAAPVLRVCVWAFAVQSIFFWTWPAAVSIQRPDYGTRVGILTALVQVLLALLFIPPFGAMGSAVALVLAYCMGQPLLAWIITRELVRAERNASEARS